MDLRAGMKIRQAVDGGSSARAALRAWNWATRTTPFDSRRRLGGAARGGLYGERYGLKYRLKY